MWSGTPAFAVVPLARLGSVLTLAFITVLCGCRNEFAHLPPEQRQAVATLQAEGGMIRLDEEGQVAWINMSGPHGLVTYVGAEHIKEFPHLKYLYLNDHVSDADLGHLMELSNLEYLWIGSAEAISDTGFAHLQNLSNLRALHFGCSGVSEDAVKELQKALPGCSIESFAQP
jgi:hypothetical protein